ncbi:MAG TPA: response regulator transcription factor [Terriglobales bacterium]
METSLIGTEEPTPQPPVAGDAVGVVRVILADSQAIFRAGLRKIFALEDDLRVVGQAETLAQAYSAAKKFTADILLFEADLSPNAPDAVIEILKQNPALRLVVITEAPDEELTLELFRRGAHAIVSREVEPELLVECLRKVAHGELWLDSRGINWVMTAYRSQASRGGGSRPKVHLTPKESLIVSCVTQGMKNKEIAQHVGTTEQVVKNYLRKVYDKLGVADRLELALFCLNNRVIEGQPAAAPAAEPSVEPTLSQPAPEAVPAAASAAAGSGKGNGLA